MKKLIGTISGALVCLPAAVLAAGNGAANGSSPRAGGIGACEETNAQLVAQVAALTEALAASEARNGLCEGALATCQEALANNTCQPPSLRRSCADILAAGESHGSGPYSIDPNGSGFAVQAVCEMDLSGGGWTRLVPAVADALRPDAVKEYLYVYQGRWYRSPATTFSWSWFGYQELLGTYAYFNGDLEGTLECTGGEGGDFGVGCSSGGGGTPKVLTIYGRDPGNGSGTLCQDIPDAFGVGACADGVAFYVRER